MAPAELITDGKGGWAARYLYQNMRYIITFTIPSVKHEDIAAISGRAQAEGH